ncbi:hypothetical protein ZIOFF_052275 [Zingiber officinale]|uniref:Uncharacterized protein n=1 Tax=Zingiber officinale TaxID=94328 RepID=A0A8J5FNX6_ZINOF|nr:hypothetical protein ZIOFF_052272 [Zingiber officinale]KAG6490943.1 hypothetical protein ZIOFF_052275 [Zingiber officinale]
MAERLEKAIKDWYQNSRVADLEYLDLATEVRLRDISHNIDVVYDRLILHSRISRSEYRTLLKVINENQAELLNSLETTSKPVDTSNQVVDIAKQLEGLSLGKTKSKKEEPFFVYKDPLKILKEEREKAKSHDEQNQA